MMIRSMGLLALGLCLLSCDDGEAPTGNGSMTRVPDGVDAGPAGLQSARRGMCLRCRAGAAVVLPGPGPHRRRHRLPDWNPFLSSGRLVSLRDGGGLNRGTTSALVSDPTTCNPCDPGCFFTTDRPVDTDLSPGNLAGVVYDSGAGGITLDDGISDRRVDRNNPSVCGDGMVEGIEECDDRNLISGDGCTIDCLVENGYCRTTTGSAAPPRRLTQSTRGRPALTDATATHSSDIPTGEARRPKHGSRSGMKSSPRGSGANGSSTRNTMISSGSSAAARIIAPSRSDVTAGPNSAKASRNRGIVRSSPLRLMHPPPSTPSRWRSRT